MKRKPVAYMVQQRGLPEYAEIAMTKKEALFIARECLWWSPHVTIRPLYAGKPLPWMSRREASRRAGL